MYPNRTPPVTRYSFPPSHRLHGKQEFARVYAHPLRKSEGPLRLMACPNCCNHHRLGLSVGKRVGNAVTRHAIKRRLREAFRLTHQTWPICPNDTGLDLVIIVYPHSILPLSEYQNILTKLVTHAVRVTQKRLQKSQTQEQ